MELDPLGASAADTYTEAQFSDLCTYLRRNATSMTMTSIWCVWTVWVYVCPLGVGGMCRVAWGPLMGSSSWPSHPLERQGHDRSHERLVGAE